MFIKYLGGEIMAVKGPVSFKGTMVGLYLVIEDGVDFNQIVVSLKQQLKQSSAFYKGAKVIGLVGQHLSYSQKAMLESILLEQSGMVVESLEAPRQESPRESIKESPVKERPIEPKPTLHEPSESAQSSDTLFVTGTLRSGKSVKHPGHVVVIGDVNPGAEIVAEGNVFVMGRIMGFIHAGSAGNDASFVVANLLKPTQIRISKYISVPPSDDSISSSTSPERAYVSNGLIKIEKIH